MPLLVRTRWLEQLARRVAQATEGVIVIGTGKKASGPVHVGSLRELVIADALRQQLAEVGRRAVVYCTIYSQSEFKRWRPGLPESFRKLEGRPFADLPCPEGCCQSFVHHHIMPLERLLKELGLEIELRFTHEIYSLPGMRRLVGDLLRQPGPVRSVLNRYFLRRPLPEGWIPFRLRCPECRRQVAAVTKVTAGALSYECPACGARGTSQLETVEGRLPFRVEWPTLWRFLGTQVEPIGRDHASRGAAYESSAAIAREVYCAQPPMAVPYEWVQSAGKVALHSSGGSEAAESWMARMPRRALVFAYQRTPPWRPVRLEPSTCRRLARGTVTADPHASAMELTKDSLGQYYSPRDLALFGVRASVAPSPTPAITLPGASCPDEASVKRLLLAEVRRNGLSPAAGWKTYREQLFDSADGPRLSRYLFVRGKAAEVAARRRRECLTAVRWAWRRLAGTSELNRLARIDTWPGISFVYPSRARSRLNHSLQAALLAVRFQMEDLPGKGAYPSARRFSSELLALALLLHDAGHGPFSYLSESTLRRVLGFGHEHRGRLLLEGGWRYPGDAPVALRLRDAEREVIGEILRGTGADLTRFVDGLESDIALSGGRYSLYWADDPRTALRLAPAPRLDRHIAILKGAFETYLEAETRTAADQDPHVLDLDDRALRSCWFNAHGAAMRCAYFEVRLPAGSDDRVQEAVDQLAHIPGAVTDVFTADGGGIIMRVGAPRSSPASREAAAVIAGLRRSSLEREGA